MRLRTNILINKQGDKRQVLIMQNKDGSFGVVDTKGKSKTGICYSAAMVTFYTYLFACSKDGFSLTKLESKVVTKAMVKKHDNYFKKVVDSEQLEMF